MSKEAIKFRAFVKKQKRAVRKKRMLAHEKLAITTKRHAQLVTNRLESKKVAEHNVEVMIARRNQLLSMFKITPENALKFTTGDLEKLYTRAMTPRKQEVKST